jgi:hypothetical protein
MEEAAVLAYGEDEDVASDARCRRFASHPTNGGTCGLYRN